MVDKKQAEKKRVFQVLGRFFSLPNLLWSFVIILAFLAIFEFFYFSHKNNQLQAEVLGVQQEVAALDGKYDELKNSDLTTTIENQKSMVEKINQNTESYDKRFQDLYEASANLQKRVDSVVEYLNKAK